MLDKDKRKENFDKDHPNYNKSEVHKPKKCLHCERGGYGGRGLCYHHYHAALKLSKEYPWKELIEKGVCLGTKKRIGERCYEELKILLRK